jgi:hypothetical protein
MKAGTRKVANDGHAHPTRTNESNCSHFFVRFMAK